MRLVKHRELRAGDLLFHSGTGIFARLIKWFTKSEWSHVSMVLEPDGEYVTVVSAEWYGVSLVAIDPNDNLIDMITVERIGRTIKQKAAILAYELAVKRPSYDYKGIFGYIMSYLLGSTTNRWQKRKAWFCSELINHCYAEAGEPIYKGIEHGLVSPGKLHEKTVRQLKSNSVITRGKNTKI